MLFCNAYMWCVYGCVTNSIYPLVVVNCVGVITSLVFSGIYYRWSSPQQRLYARKLWFAAATGLLLSTAYAVIGVQGATNQLPNDVAATLGFVCVTANTCLFASPLETMGKVIRTKSAASLPISLCIANLVSGALWSVMAVCQNDMFVLAPNALGTVLSAVQVALYIKYPPPPEMNALTLRSETARPIPIVTSATKLEELSIKIAAQGVEFQPVLNVKADCAHNRTSSVAIDRSLTDY
ncbi:hypothetical protein BBO99_00005274 [Phytophthora kernoviae]|uniref:Sugar transporter SWEET1 n=1 Tax=Phytophthora kernoviae TaxID=325452 RepID=A0A421EWM7_9STRA|nr:hypothetical protein BBI17_004607 [Phytophthora kernoviae]RLN79422.1 hypothetical protein BBO99_00005274 [Phytophthora kernoviae]